MIPTDPPLWALAAGFALCAGCIWRAGTVLTLAADGLAARHALARSLVGLLLLATATSLPEIVTTIAAVRAGAHTLAISNVFGSNLIMLVLVLPADALYRPGPILAAAGDVAALAICFGLIATGIFLSGLIVRRKPVLGRLGLDSVLVLATFALSLAAYWIAG